MYLRSLTAVSEGSFGTRPINLTQGHAVEICAPEFDLRLSISEAKIKRTRISTCAFESASLSGKASDGAHSST